MSLSSIHLCHGRRGLFSFFFFNDTATTEIYTLSLHDALPIYLARLARDAPRTAALRVEPPPKALETRLRQSLDPEGNVLDGASRDVARARQAVREARERLIRRLDAILGGLDAGERAPDAAGAARGGGP